MKLYTNPTCHYCKKIKESLDTNANIQYEEVLMLVKIKQFGMNL